MNYELVYPMAAMVLLTFGVLIRLFLGRVHVVRAGEVSGTYYKTFQEGEEPRELAQLSRHFINLFESPTLFYVACVVAMVTGQSGTTLLVLAWVYFAMRVVHALIHLRRNKIQPRIGAYLASWIVLIAMWSTIIVGVTTGQ